MEDTRVGDGPRVSVVVPVYNLADCVGRCIDSVLVQTFADFEVICVDDASSDGTPGVLDAYAKRDGRVRVVTLPRSEGPSVARNCGVEVARGELVSFVDGDDFVSPFYLQILVDAYDAAGEGSFVKAGNVRGLYERVRDTSWRVPSEGEVRVLVTESAIRDLLLDRLSVVAWACIAPRELYMEHRFPEGMVFEDHYVVFDHLAASAVVVAVDTPVYAYVTRPVSLSNPALHDESYPEGMYRAVEHLLDMSRGWKWDEEVAWAAAWRLALVVRYCQDVEDKRKVRKYYRQASSYLRANLRSIVSICEREHLSREQLRKIVISAASPRIYWLLRMSLRRVGRIK